jgi:uncharacterized protein (DUF58 family)
MGPARWLVTLGAIAVVAPSRGAVPLIALVLLAGIASRWSVRRVARGLEVRAEVPRWASYGEAFEVVTQLRNTSRVPAPWVELDLPCGMGLGRTTPHREALPLQPGERITRRIPLTGTARGRHHVGPAGVRLGDVFGVARVRAASGPGTDVIVLPRIVPLRSLGLPAASPYVTVPARHSPLVDAASVVGTRDYRTGDALKAVHWPITARTGRLTVKEYEHAEARETIVCLDLSRDGYPSGERRSGPELAITVAASVVHHTVSRQGLPAGLLVGSPATAGAGDVVYVPPRADRGHLLRMLEKLALADPGTGPSLPGLLDQLGRDLPTGTTLLVVTGRLTSAVMTRLLERVRGGVPTAVAVAGSVSARRSWETRAVAVYHVTHPEAMPGLGS